MKISIGADHRGVDALDHVASELKQQGHQVVLIEQGPDDGQCDYPDVAYPVANAVSLGQAQRGILICCTGIGMSIAANKIKGIRAALVHDEIGADLSRRHNDANVLCISADMLGIRTIHKIINTWLETPFDGGRHQRRIDKISQIERGLPSSVYVKKDLGDSLQSGLKKV